MLKTGDGFRQKKGPLKKKGWFIFISKSNNGFNSPTHAQGWKKQTKTGRIDYRPCSSVCVFSHITACLYHRRSGLHTSFTAKLVNSDPGQSECHPSPAAGFSRCQEHGETFLRKKTRGPGIKIADKTCNCLRRSFPDSDLIALLGIHWFYYKYNWKLVQF